MLHGFRHGIEKLEGGPWDRERFYTGKVYISFTGDICNDAVQDLAELPCLAVIEYQYLLPHFRGKMLS